MSNNKFIDRRCFSKKHYDKKLRYCKKCGWSPIKNQKKLEVKK